MLGSVTAGVEPGPLGGFTLGQGGWLLGTTFCDGFGGVTTAGAGVGDGGGGGGGTTGPGGEGFAGILLEMGLIGGATSGTRLLPARLFAHSLRRNPRARRTTSAPTTHHNHMRSTWAAICRGAAAAAYALLMCAANAGAAAGCVSGSVNAAPGATGVGSGSNEGILCHAGGLYSTGTQTGRYEGPLLGDTPQVLLLVVLEAIVTTSIALATGKLSYKPQYCVRARPLANPNNSCMRRHHSLSLFGSLRPLPVYCFSQLSSPSGVTRQVLLSPSEMHAHCHHRLRMHHRPHQ